MHISKSRPVHFILICAFTLLTVIPDASAGVGARHFMEGAFFSKYLTKPPRDTKSSHVLTYGSAFFVGVLSHGLSDHIGNYEPHSTDPEYYYFIGEGILGCVLLYPEWRKDPRLFCGSVGGVFPDIDQMEPFGRKIYPTHSGEVPHFKIKEFWRGAVLNLAINGLAYYAIRHDLFSNEDYRSHFSLGYSVGYWNSQGALRRGAGKWPSGKNGSPLRQIHLLYESRDFLTADLTFGDWIRDVRDGDAVNKDYPPRVNLDSYASGLELHPRSGKRFQPYVAAGAAVYHASISGAVDKGKISFSTHAATTLGVYGGAGIKVKLNRFMRLVLDQRYHEVRFGKYLDGTKCYSGWAAGIGIEHKL